MGPKGFRAALTRMSREEFVVWLSILQIQASSTVPQREAGSGSQPMPVHRGLHSQMISPVLPLDLLRSTQQIRMCFFMVRANSTSASTAILVQGFINRLTQELHGRRWFSRVRYIIAAKSPLQRPTLPLCMSRGIPAYIVPQMQVLHGQA